MPVGEDEVLSTALDALAGPALVLDATRRIRFATTGARTLLGRDIPIGVTAASFLCGNRSKRPVSDALDAGRPVSAIIPLPGRADGASLRVRVIPHPARRPLAFVVLLEPEAAASGAGPVLFHGMWTQDRGMKAVFRVIERVAVDDDTVLVRGETGAGKELVAAAIHRLSPRRRGPFRAINCAALPPTLLERELGDLVEEQRPLVRELNVSGRIAVGPGERAPDVAEELTLEQGRR